MYRIQVYIYILQQIDIKSYTVCIQQLKFTIKKSFISLNAERLFLRFFLFFKKTNVKRKRLENVKRPEYNSANIYFIIR